jgi:hypothetical protein
VWRAAELCGVEESQDEHGDRAGGPWRLLMIGAISVSVLATLVFMPQHTTQTLVAVGYDCFESSLRGRPGHGGSLAGASAAPRVAADLQE